MGGGWVGYVYAIVGCGGFTLLIGTSALVLLLVARVRGSRERVRVVDVTARD